MRDHTYGPVVVLGGGAVSDEQDTRVHPAPDTLHPTSYAQRTTPYRTLRATRPHTVGYPLSAGAASSRHLAKMSTLACSKDLKISSQLDFF